MAADGSQRRCRMTVSPRGGVTAGPARPQLRRPLHARGARRRHPRQHGRRLPLVRCLRRRSPRRSPPRRSPPHSLPTCPLALPRPGAPNHPRAPALPLSVDPVLRGDAVILTETDSNDSKITACAVPLLVRDDRRWQPTTAQTDRAADPRPRAQVLRRLPRGRE
jgi:hypothetical protein